MPTRAVRSVALYAVFLLSGAAGLGYEILWTRQLAMGLGHEMPGLLAVVAAFFGGVALGAWALDRRIARSARPGPWYAALEAIVALWGVVGVFLLPAINRLAPMLIGPAPGALRQWAVAFTVPMIALLPATAAMGATLPAMERLVARLRGRGTTVAGLYAVNTAGAMAGTLAATWFLLPALGFRSSMLVLAAVSALCAVVVAAGFARGEAARPAVVHDFADPPTPRRLAATLVLTGLLGIGYEILCVRVMAQVLENTVYSFAAALSVYLLGTALGAALYQRLTRKRDFAFPLAWLVQMEALACLVGILVLRDAGSIYDTWRERLGGGPAAAMAAEMILAAFVFLLPTMAMGATFGHLAQAARRADGGLGRALGLNTIGAALAPLVFGVILLPLLGTKWSMVVASLGFLGLIPVVEPLRLVPAGVALLLLATLPRHLVLVEAPPGSRIVAYREGVMAAVAVTQDEQGRRLLKVNNRFYMGGTSHAFAHPRQAHIALLLHPDPRAACFLGLGTAMTAGAATVHPGLSIRGVELLPEVVELLPMFAPANRLGAVPESAYVVGDARTFVRATDERYDVVVADLFHPARDGSGALYTVEHFAAVRDRLAEGGLFCQWLPLYQLDLDTLRMIVRSFLAVFPDATAHLAHFNTTTPMVGLLGRMAPLRMDGSYFADRVPPDPVLRRALLETALLTDVALLGTLIADAQGLRRFAGEGPLNTDDHPRVIFQAPRHAYRPDEPPWVRLMAILAEGPPDVHALVAGDADDLARRGADFIAARDLYLEAHIEGRAGRTRAMHERLLDAARRSGEFQPAILVLLTEAQTLARRDPAAARMLLEALVEARPEDGRAQELLRQLPE